MTGGIRNNSNITVEYVAAIYERDCLEGEKKSQLNDSLDLPISTGHFFSSLMHLFTIVGVRLV